MISYILYNNLVDIFWYNSVICGILILSHVVGTHITDNNSFSSGEILMKKGY